MSKHTLDINTILHTRDGRIVGNAIVIGRHHYFWKIKTDYGNEVEELTERQLHALFYIGYSDREDCAAVQKRMQSDHKHRVCDQPEKMGEPFEKATECTKDSAVRMNRDQSPEYFKLFLEPRPKWLQDEQRKAELVRAINCFRNLGMVIRDEWVEELKTLMKLNVDNSLPRE